MRAETSPDDVHGMARAAGILTSRGGLASHAAVVARGWGIPAVVGATGVEVRDGHVTIGDRVLAAGDVITIDGASGDVFEGVVAGTTEVVPEARTLGAWAAELGVEVGPSGRSDPALPAASVPTAAPTASDVTPDRCVQVIAIKGFALPAAVADAVRAPIEAVQPILDRLAADGLVTTSAGALRLTDAGSARSAELLAADRAAMGAEAATIALDDFLDLDRRMKDIVTAWQLRDPAAQVLNDHTDPDYDRGVLERLGALHADTVAWLTPLEPSLARFTDYRARLEGAEDLAQAGDGRYVASPRVDSYHGVWFELHEDLIQLAGRTRADEVEAGRA